VIARDFVGRNADISAELSDNFSGGPDLRTQEQHMRHIKTAAMALIVGLVLLMATDYVAMAATGKPFLLGKVNKASKTTSVKSASGPALKLSTVAGQPPLLVNRNTVVKNFNADLLDGKTASQFGIRSKVYAAQIQAINTNFFSVKTPSIAAGNYVVTLSGFLNVPANASVECTVGPESGDPYYIDQWIPGNVDGKASFNAATAAGIAVSQPLYVECYSGATGTISSFNGTPLRLAFTSIDTVTSGALTPVL
jgi:hypothetical protein